MEIITNIMLENVNEGTQKNLITNNNNNNN